MVINIENKSSDCFLEAFELDDDSFTYDRVDQFIDARNTTDPEIEKAVRLEIQRREQRSSLLPDGIFGEPAWNILLDLYLSNIIRRHVTVTDACVASGSPKTSAIRWIGLLESYQLVEKCPSEADRRVMHLKLTHLAKSRLDSYFKGD